VSFTSPLVVSEISQVSKARFKAKASIIFIEGSQRYIAMLQIRRLKKISFVDCPVKIGIFCYDV
jgi:hypothetical protein